jgi:hypothetical protein
VTPAKRGVGVLYRGACARRSGQAAGVLVRQVETHKGCRGDHDERHDAGLPAQRGDGVGVRGGGAEDRDGDCVVRLFCSPRCCRPSATASAAPYWETRCPQQPPIAPPIDRVVARLRQSGDDVGAAAFEDSVPDPPAPARRQSDLPK